MKPKKLLIVSGDPNINDIEWKLPIIKFFVENCGQVTVWLPYFEKAVGKSQKIYIKLLKGMNAEIIKKKDFQKKFDFNIVNDENSLLRRILMSESHWISKIILTRYIRKYILKKKVSQEMKKYEYIFLCQYPEISNQLTLQSIHKIAINSKAKLYGVPDACHVKWNNKKIAKYDRVLLNSKGHIEDFKKYNPDMQYIVAGANHLTKNWLKYFKDQYEKEFSPSYKTKNNLLLILGKPDHFYWRGIDQEKLLLDTFNRLFQTKYFILIKPHPRHNLDHLKKIMDKVAVNSEKKYLIIDDPINVATNYVKHVISFPSYGVIGPQSIGKVPFLFWPLNGNYLDALMNKKINEPFKKTWLKKNLENKVVTIFDDYCFSIDKIDKIMNHSNDIIYDNNLLDKKKENFYKLYSINETLNDKLKEIFCL